MSDAITLDVLSSSPVQLDAGDADPIAREEIAELAERVEAIEADYVTAEDVMGALGGEAPTLVSGSSRALLGDAETASWMERTTAADGAALVESVKGNTLRWNQLIRVTNQTDTINGVTFVSQANGGTITANGEATAGSNRAFAVNVLANHKYLYHGCPTGGSSDTYGSVLTGLPSVIPSNNWDYGSGNMVTARNDGTATFIVAHIATGHNAANLVFRPQLFDLTVMFGAGNEPATVAEFEALFPEPYYPYDAGSLLPVRMEGVETVAADESWSSQRTIPAETYFPQGMRSAGTVRDELRADAAITRVGERAYQSGDESDASVITDGTVTHYALATPTTTPIDPPLPMSYRVGAGGTERVMVASGTTSAPPVLSIAYGHTAEGIVREAASAIATQDGPTATTNHAVGSYLTMGGKLYRVTTAIATGEAIVPGTNVMATTVMAEVLSLIQ